VHFNGRQRAWWEPRGHHRDGDLGADARKAVSFAFTYEDTQTGLSMRFLSVDGLAYSIGIGNR